jgi:hypothetical protein
MSKIFFGAFIHISLPSLVRLLYAYCHDWGFVRQLTNASSRQTLSFAGIRVSAACARPSLYGLLIGGEGMVVEVPYQQIRTDIRRLQAKGIQHPFPLFRVLPAIFLPAVSAH